MSLFIAGAIAGAGLVASLLVAMSEQIRAELRRRCDVRCDEQRSDESARLAGPHRLPTASVATSSPKAQQRAANPVSAETRAAAYREILDALGDDLDQDIAEWEAVLQDFPQVIGAAELRATDERPSEPVLETAIPDAESITPLSRTRRISAEESGMIQRLLRTGFAPEEIALWLNLPLERVQELLLRYGLT